MIMAKVDLSGYELSELKGLQHDVERAIKERQHQELQKAREQILAIAQEVGGSIEVLFSAPVKKAQKESGPKVAPRYRNPKDSTQTWSGRGRQPRWIAEGLASGKTLDEFRMQ
jgi:DNA-binding protein H-NS